MRNTRDLFVEEDVLSYFDNTCNHYSRELLKSLLRRPLNSTKEIEVRQEVLKAFTRCPSLLYAYEYKAIDLQDVYLFLTKYPQEHFINRDIITFKWFNPKKNELIGNYIHLIFFLRKLQIIFLENISIQNFPKQYQEDLSFLKRFLLFFELEKMNDKIKKGKFGFESIRFLNEVLLRIRKNGDDIKFFDILFQFEVHLSIAKTIVKRKFSFPEIDTEEFEIQSFFHPDIVAPVCNDVHFKSNVILLTGANMAGKSTLLKSIGLCVYLGHLGLAIPAKSARLPFFENIAVLINHNDDLKNGYSHFVTEIKNLKHVVTNAKAGKPSFVIFDELFKGTNFEDARTISKATIEGLMNFKHCLFIISTHISELQTDLESDDNGQFEAYFLDSYLVDQKPVFTYKIKQGWSILKIGEIIFKNEGLYDLLQRSNKFCSS